MKKILLVLTACLSLMAPTFASEATENITKLVDNSLSNTSIIHGATLKDLQINNDASKKDDNKIVLVYLTWTVSNSASTTKTMLEMYSARLVNQISKEPSVNEVVVFWEVPYHKEDANIAKFNYVKKNGEFYTNGKWFDPVIR